MAAPNAHAAPAVPDSDSAAPSPLITAAELAAELRSPRPPVILDVRWSLGGDGYDAFLLGRIPGAFFIDLDRELAAPAGLGGRHPLPERAAVVALLTRAGVTGLTTVVVCGQRDTSIAGRAWWLLRWAGHPDVRVLDGGFEAWRRGGGAVEVGAPPAGHGVESVPGAAPRPAEPDERGDLPTVDADAVAGLSAAGVLLDARAPERYRGEVEPVDPMPGHIPGAVNVPLAAVHDTDGLLLPAARLREVLAAAGVRADTPAAASCGSGVTACSLILAGAVVGLELALYPGSYSGWCALRRPVEKG